MGNVFLIFIPNHDLWFPTSHSFCLHIFFVIPRRTVSA